MVRTLLFISIVGFLGCNAISDFPPQPVNQAGDSGDLVDLGPLDVGEGGDMDGLDMPRDDGPEPGDVSIPDLPISSTPSVWVLGEEDSSQRPALGGLPYMSSAWVGTGRDATLIYGATGSNSTSVHRMTVFGSAGIDPDAFATERVTFSLDRNSLAAGIRFRRDDTGNVFGALLANSCGPSNARNVVYGELEPGFPLDDPLFETDGDCSPPDQRTKMGASAGGFNIFDSSKSPVQLTWYEEKNGAFAAIQSGDPTRKIRSAYTPESVFTRNTQSTSGKFIFFVDEQIWYWNAEQVSEGRGSDPVPNDNLPVKLPEPEFGPKTGAWAAAHLSDDLYAVAQIINAGEVDEVEVRLWQEQSDDSLQKVGEPQKMTFDVALNEVTLAPFPGGLGIWVMQADAPGLETGTTELVMMRYEATPTPRLVELQRIEETMVEPSVSLGITMSFHQADSTLVAAGVAQMDEGLFEVFLYEWKNGGSL